VSRPQIYEPKIIQGGLEKLVLCEID